MSGYKPIKRRHLVRQTMTEWHPKNLVFLDCESHWKTDKTGFKWTQTHSWRLACAEIRQWNGVSWDEGSFEDTDRDRFWGQLVSCLSSRETTWIIAHNAVIDLTLLGFWGRVESGEVDISLLLIDDLPFCIGGKINGRSFKIVDSFNYVQEKLDLIGSSIGIPKLPIPKQEYSDKVWFKYCRRDVQILAHFMTGVIDEFRDNGYGRFGISATSLAWSAYRTRFMRHPIMIHDNPFAYKLERYGYFGGDVRTFKTGEGRGLWHMIDVNSIYPAMMQKYNYPTKLLGYTAKATTENLAVCLASGSVMADVELRAIANRWKVRKGRETYRTSGHIRTTLTTLELRQALACGEIIKVHGLAHYQSAPIFSDFVDHFWGKKVDAIRENDLVKREFNSLILKSLSGKFGQRDRKWKPSGWNKAMTKYGIYYVDQGDNMPPEIVRVFGGHVEKYIVQGEWEDSFPAIPAHITAYARDWMDSVILDLGEEHCWYQGVDSLIVDDSAFQAIKSIGGIDVERLGAFKIKESGDYLKISSANCYRIGSLMVDSMIPKSSRKIDGSRVWSEQWPSISDIIGRETNDEFMVQCGYSESRLLQYKDAKEGWQCHTDRVENWSPKEIEEASHLKWKYH